MYNNLYKPPKANLNYKTSNNILWGLLIWLSIIFLLLNSFVYIYAYFKLIHPKIDDLPYIQISVVYLSLITKILTAIFLMFKSSKANFLCWLSVILETFGLIYIAFITKFKITATFSGKGLVYIFIIFLIAIFLYIAQKKRILK